MDDLGVIDPSQVRRGDSEVGVPELPLDDNQRDAFPGHLDRVGVPELVRSKPAPHARRCRSAV